MAAVEVTISGVLYDKYNRTQQNVVLIGEGSLTGLGVGGGPIVPPGQPPSGAHPSHPIALPGDPWWGTGGPPDHIWGPTDPRPTPPIYIPPAVPPDMQPPAAPSPGDPTTAVPGNHPVQPITPPPYIVVQYPGIGPVVVAPPAAG